jgi:hypothetical protein
MTLFEMTITDCPGFHVPHSTCIVTRFILSYKLLKLFKKKKEMTLFIA